MAIRRNLHLNRLRARERVGSDVGLCMMYGLHARLLSQNIETCPTVANSYRHNNLICPRFSSVWREKNRNKDGTREHQDVDVLIINIIFMACYSFIFSQLPEQLG